MGPRTGPGLVPDSFRPTDRSATLRCLIKPHGSLSKVEPPTEPMTKPLTLHCCGLTAVFSRADAFSSWVFERQQGRGLYEEFATETFLEHVKPHTCVLDVGANIGWYSVWASIKSPGATIHAFEIDPDNCRRFRINANLNRCRNVRLWQTAVGDSSSPLCYDPQGARSPLEYRVRPLGHPSGRRVSCTTLDSWCLENSVRPELIKVDVEGFEYAVLQGMQGIIRDLKPTLLLEYHRKTDDSADNGLEVIRRIMEPLGYSMCELSKNSIRTIVPARAGSVAANSMLLFR